MPWPKGKPRKKKTSTSDQRAVNNFKDCAACGESKNFTQYGYRYWRKGWKGLRANDPEKYRDSCKDCTRAKNGVEVDPNFPADRGRRPGRPNKRWKDHFKKTPSQMREYRREYRARVRARARVSCLRYLAKKGCENCGTHDPRVLEFDHLDPKKKKVTISHLLSQGFSWANEKVRREVRKCRVLCANCHRLHTIKQQGYYAHDDVKSELDKILRDQGIDP